MRRIIHNTTAIAACLSLLTPHLAVAQESGRNGGAGHETSLAQALEELLPRDKPAEAESGDDGAASAAVDDMVKERPQQAQRDRKAERPVEAQRAQGTARPETVDQVQAEPGPSDEQAEIARNLQPASSAEAERRAGNMRGLARVLAAELDAGLTETELNCVVGGQSPCGEGDRLITPKGVVVERDEHGGVMLALARSQMFRVNAQGEMRPRAAEEGVTETEAAREAAQETAVSAIAAALQEGRQGERHEERVSEEAARRSSEDFATSLRDALQGAVQDTGASQNRAANGEDGDLAKALLLGLGAIAVGSYLDNNRRVALSTPDRVVVTRTDGSQEVIKDDVALLRQPGTTVETENFDDGSSRTVVTRADGSKVITIRDADLRVLRRTLIMPDGRTTRLIDDTQEVAPVDVASLPEPAPVRATPGASLDEAALREALRQETGVDRRFTLGQIRNIPEVRALVAPVDLDAITFNTGSAAINPDQARQLAALGRVIQDAVARDRHEIFMIEGHTDTVGAEAMNLALSDRRAETVALALTEYFDVPPENLVVQGYGEQFLKVRAEGDIRENRRASVRRITDLLQTAGTE